VKSKKINRKEELAAKYKRAFDDICGDPYALEPFPGNYEVLKQRSAITIIEPGRAGNSPSPQNKARPNQLDFFVDVERAVEDGLLTYQKKTDYTFDELVTIFDNTYWIESGVIFTQKQRAEIEQIIGRILSARKISPAGKYFVAIRK
jgi:hypothetical protein